MKQKRDDADSELERPFEFSKARPNPYAGWSRRAKGDNAKTREDPLANEEAPLQPPTRSARPARVKNPHERENR